MARNASLESRFLKQIRIPPGNKADAGTIHDLRVLGKKLRAYLRLVRPVLGKKEAEKWDRKISESAGAMASARTAHVIGKLLAKLGPQADSSDLRQKLLPSSSTRAKPSPREAGQFRSVLEKTKQVLLEALPRIKKQDLRREIGRSRKKVLKRKKKAGGCGSGPLFHQWRKSAKRLLYQLELAGSGKNRRQEKEIKCLKKVEDGLGKIHDWDELRCLLEKSPSRKDHSAILRQIHKRQKKQAKRIFRKAGKP